MRFLAAIGAVALFTVASADQTGETEADNSNSGNVPALTSDDAVTVTVTDADCSGGKCSAAAQTIPSSTVTRNALTVLSNALNAPTPSNALVVLSEAANDHGIPGMPYTFAPELYSSYGLTGVSEGESSQEETAAPTTGTAPPATYGTTATEVTSAVVPTTTTPAPIPVPTTEATGAPASSTPSTLETVTSGDSTANPVSSGPTDTGSAGGATTTPTGAPTGLTSGSSTYGDSTLVSPVGGSSTTVPAESTGSAGETTTAGPESTGGPGSSGGNGGSSTQSDATANPEQTSGGTNTAPVPEATGNFGIKNQPAAFGGLVAAVGGLLFI